MHMIERNNDRLFGTTTTFGALGATTTFGALGAFGGMPSVAPPSIPIRVRGGDSYSRLYSSIVYRFPMDLLHVPHIGRMLPRFVSPPRDSGMLCPASKLNGVITAVHHVTVHL
jgi:hypothetical protein